MSKVNKVFLIDDDSIFNLINEKTIENILSPEKIVAYEKAERAIAELRSMQITDFKDFPDVIFLDVNMPNMDGWEFLNEYSQLPEHAISKCRLYMLTSSIDPSDIARSKKYFMVCDFISKPLTSDKLLSLRK